MPYICADLAALENKPVVGNGDCVTLIKVKVPGLRGVPTSAWREGEKVVGSKGIQRGTAIATFENGRYPTRAGNKHAAIFLAYAGAAIWVLDQWDKPTKLLVERRLIRPGLRRRDGTPLEPSNAAQAFSVIELPK